MSACSGACGETQRAPPTNNSELVGVAASVCSAVLARCHTFSTSAFACATTASAFAVASGPVATGKEIIIKLKDIHTTRAGAFAAGRLPLRSAKLNRGHHQAINQA
jgi:hypothetical protein